jgi:hypothetical protein
MTETLAPSIEQPAPTPTAAVGDEAKGDFASGERTEPKIDENASDEGDFAAGERTAAQAGEPDPEGELHGDFAAGERTEPLTTEGSDEGTFGDAATQ